MKPIADTLSENLDTLVTIADDDRAESALSQLGLEFPERRDFPDPVAEILVCDTIPTHMLCAVRFSGHALHKDNGFTLHFLPRSGFPEGSAAKMAEGFRRQYIAAGHKAFVLR